MTLRERKLGGCGKLFLGWAIEPTAVIRQKEVPPRTLVFFSRAAFMRQKKLKVEQVLLQVARDSSDKYLSGEAAA